MDSHSRKMQLLMFVYAVIFIFSIYAIIQIRFYASVEGISETDGKFMLWLFRSDTISHGEFVNLKLTLFVITAASSYILMITNYFFYRRPKLHDRILRRAHHEIKKELKKRKEHNK